MSDQTNVPTNDQPTVKPKRTNAPRIDHSAAIAAYAKAKGVDTTRAGKLFRARLRANFDTISKRDAKHYGPKGAYKHAANDNRPWGDHSRAVLREIGLLSK